MINGKKRGGNYRLFFVLRQRARYILKKKYEENRTFFRSRDNIGCKLLTQEGPLNAKRRNVSITYKNERG